MKPDLKNNEQKRNGPMSTRSGALIRLTTACTCQNFFASIHPTPWPLRYHVELSWDSIRISLRPLVLGRTTTSVSTLKGVLKRTSRLIVMKRIPLVSKPSSLLLERTWPSSSAKASSKTCIIKTSSSSKSRNRAKSTTTFSRHLLSSHTLCTYTNSAE